MTPLVRALAKYREYHRDRRNLATHALGIPLIVLALDVLLAGLGLLPLAAANALAALWYLRLDFRMGLLMSLLLALIAALGLVIARNGGEAWLLSVIALFVLGWALQFLGHHYEGRKPAFVDDVRSLLVGPLFVAVEALFALGLLAGLKAEVERG